MGLISASCGNPFKEKEVQSNSQLFAKEQSLLLSSAPQIKSAFTQEKCSVAVTSVLYKHQELQATISSNQITKIQVAVEPSMNFVDLETTNGVLIWPGNTFEANSYILHFRGIKADGTSIACNPAQSAVTILNSQLPWTTPVAASCSVDLPSTLLTNQELQATITSNEIAKMQVRIEPSLDYVDLSKTNGVLQFPVNSFPAGNYLMYFRGLKLDGTSVACNPSHRNLVVSAPATPSPNDPGSAINSNYYALNSNVRGLDFKTAFSPDKVYYDGNLALLQSALGTANAVGLSQIRLFIPPGTIQVGITTSAYLSDEDGRVAVSFRALPRASYSDVTSTTSYSGVALLTALLEKKEELHFYAPSRSGGIMLINPGADKISPLQNGGWLYLNFLSIPGGTIYNIQTRVTVDKTCYQNWYKQASWDTEGNPAEGVYHRCN